jgi:uncharacterized protein (TIGR02145 family)
VKTKIRIYFQTLTSALLLLFAACNEKENNEILPIPDTVTDIDGNIYHTLVIGTQVWLQENLKVTHYRNGDSIPVVSDSIAWGKLTTGACCDYGNLPVNGTIYGKLYNWYAIEDYRRIAPSGWHVSTDADWAELSNSLGGELVAGNKLKETGTAHWITNAGATNETGFTALPGGARGFTGTFDDFGTSGGWWSYCGSNTSSGCYDRWLLSNMSPVYRNYNYKGVGFSVRCVKDRITGAR